MWDWNELPEWLEDNARQQLEQAAEWLWWAGRQLLIFLIIYSALIYFYLLVRAIKLRFGARQRPNGTKAIIITGATSGFGLAATKRLYKLGFTVFACYYSDQEPGYAELLGLKLRPIDALERAKQVVGRSDYKRPSLFLIKMDVRSSESIELSGREIESLLDLHSIRLMGLINNAGNSRDGPFELASAGSIRDLVETNLIGPVMVTKRFVLRLIRSQGRVVNISSGLYPFAGPSQSLYGSVKCALVYFSDSLNEDLEPYGASCHAVVPGNFITNHQSNILYTRVRCLQESLGELSDLERQTYAEKIETYSRSVNHLFRLRLEQDKERPETIARLFKVQIPDDLSATKPPHLSAPMRLLCWLLSFLNGGSRSASDLDTSGVVGAYVDSICLRSPPRRLYGGSLGFKYLFGPMHELCPSALIASLGTPITYSLLRVRK